jgi:hypothetical protein
MALRVEKVTRYPVGVTQAISPNASVIWTNEIGKHLLCTTASSFSAASAGHLPDLQARTLLSRSSSSAAWCETLSYGFLHFRLD